MSPSLALLGRTLLVGAGAVAGAAALGIPAGILLGRTAVPLRPLFRILLAAPLVAPPLILALAWQDLLAGRAPGLLRGLAGTAAILALWLAPLVAFATEALVRRTERSLEEAAFLAEASAWQVVRRVTLPLAAPPLAAVLLFAFALAIGEFAVPAVLGASVYPSEIFIAFADAHDLGDAAAKSIPLLLLAVAAAATASLAGLDRVVATLGTRGARPPLVFALGRRGTVAAVGYLVALVSLAILVPIGSLAARTDARTLAEAASLALPAFRTSLLAAISGATGALAAGLLLATAGRRGGSRRRVETAALLGVFALPPGVLGLGLLELSTAAPPLEWAYERGAFLVLGLVARFAPLAACFLAAVRAEIPRSLEEAAQVAGLGYAAKLGRVLAPLMAGGIAVAWLLAFVLALGELGTTFPLLPAGMETVPARVFAIHANAPEAKVAAASLLLFGLAIGSTGALFTLGRLLGGRRP